MGDHLVTAGAASNLKPVSQTKQSLNSNEKKTFLFFVCLWILLF